MKCLLVFAGLLVLVGDIRGAAPPPRSEGKSHGLSASVGPVLRVKDGIRFRYELRHDTPDNDWAFLRPWAPLGIVFLDDQGREIGKPVFAQIILPDVFRWKEELSTSSWVNVKAVPAGARSFTVRLGVSKLVTTPKTLPPP